MPAKGVGDFGDHELRREQRSLRGLHPFCDIRVGLVHEPLGDNAGVNNVHQRLSRASRIRSVESSLAGLDCMPRIFRDRAIRSSGVSGTARLMISRSSCSNEWPFSSALSLIAAMTLSSRLRTKT